VTIRLIAVDIDGTLLDSRGALPASNRDALVDAASRGIDIVLATGRSFVFTRPVADQLPIPLTLIVNNGAVVKHKSGATAMRHVLPRDTARAILEATPHYDEHVALVFDRNSVDDARQTMYERMDWTLPNRKGYFRVNSKFITRAAGRLVDELTDDPIQVMFNGRVSDMRDLAGALRALPAAHQFSIALTEYEARDFALVDVNGAGCSKGSTLARWAAARGLPREAVAAVGDNLNDVEMLDFAGTAFVMANASDAMKRRGYRETASHDHGGLAVAVKEALKG
jgi:Cof subfamily protein (haloacid dehalogenase superfamily)